MKKFSDLLERFANISQKSDLVKDLINESIKECGVNFNLKKDQITVRNNVVILKTTPIQKNEIFLKKEKILKKFKSKKHLEKIENIL